MINHFFVRITKSNDELEVQSAKSLAEQLELEIIHNEILSLKEDSAAFAFEGKRLIMELMLEDKLTKLSFDLNEGEVAIRAGKASKSNEVVAKAIGCKPHYRPCVLDATAGMGRDAFIMATLGCKVTMLERNYAIYHLLENALIRLKNDEKFMLYSQRLTLNNTDSVMFSVNDKEFDVIYLDPMFPERKKSALVKKEMRLFKRLAGEDLDADKLFEHALNSQAKRVVVKRPKGAPCLGNKKPSHEIVAKKFRYDVYLIG